jgi:hypothetical protein
MFITGMYTSSIVHTLRHSLMFITGIYTSSIVHTLRHSLMFITGMYTFEKRFRLGVCYLINASPLFSRELYIPMINIKMSSD